MAPQLGGQAFQRIARRGQRGFGFATRSQGELQFGIQRVGGQAGEFVAGLGQSRLVGSDFLLDALKRFTEFLDLVGAGGEREPGFLMASLGRALQFVARNKLIACTNCGMAPMARGVAEAKLAALTRGAALAS